MLKSQWSTVKKTDTYETRRVIIFDADFEAKIDITYERPNSYIRLVIKGESNKKRLGDLGIKKFQFDKKYYDFKVFELNNDLKFYTQKKDERNNLIAYPIGEFLDIVIDKFKKYYEKTNG